MMVLNLFLIGKINWDSPLPYLFILLAIVLFATAKVLINIRHLLSQTVTNSNMDVSFGEYFLKWASENGTKVAVILFIIVAAAVIWAISYS